MACNPTATLTLFRTVTSTTIITTSTLTPQTQPDGSVSTVTVPLIITSVITVVNPSETQYASCPSTSTTINTATSTSPQQSPTTTITITTTPSPIVVTVPQTTTLANGAITVYSITSTSTPPATTLTWIPAASSQPSKSSSSIAPIAGGAAGGFILLVSAVALAWFIWKKCRSNGVTEEEDVVFPYPVTRDRDTRQLDLTRESRAYEYGHVGRSSQMAAPGSSPPQSHDGRPESSAGLIGASSVGLTPMASASGPLATMYGAQTRIGDVGRQASQNSHLLPAGAAPPDHISHSAGSVSASSSAGPTSPNRRPLQVMNSPPSPIPQLPVSSSGAVPGSTSPPLAVYEPEKQSAWPGRTHARGASSTSGAMFSNDSHFQGRDDGPSGSGPVVPEPIHGEPLDAPPAYED